MAHITKETTQTQIALAYPSVPVGDPDYYNAQGAVNVLSGGAGNDLLLGGAKCAGILIESVPEGAIVGFGANLAAAPAGTQRRVAALADSGAPGEPPAPSLVLVALSATFAAWRARWRDEGFAAIRAAWLARATPIGWQASVRIGTDERRGRFAGLAEDGAMLLERDGRVETIHAGDVMAA